MCRSILIPLCLLGLWSVRSAPAEGKRGAFAWENVPEKDRQKIQRVVQYYSLSRELPNVEFNGTESVYHFLLERLPLAADVIRALGIQNYRVRDNGDGTFEADDGAGATGTFHLAYEQPGKRVYYAIGRYEGDLIRIRGRAVLVVEFEEVAGPKMRNWVSIYYKFDSIVIGTVVKAFSPLIGPLVDRKVSYFLNATRDLCSRIVTDPHGVYEALRKSGDISQSELEEFQAMFLREGPQAAQPK